MTWMTCPLCWSLPCMCHFRVEPFVPIPFVPYEPPTWKVWPAPSENREPVLTDEELRQLRRLLKKRRK